MQRGVNRYDQPIVCVATVTLPDLFNKNTYILIEGREYTIIGEYVGEIETSWMIQDKYSFILVSKEHVKIKC